MRPKFLRISPALGLGNLNLFSEAACQRSMSEHFNHFLDSLVKLNSKDAFTRSARTFTSTATPGRYGRYDSRGQKTQDSLQFSSSSVKRQKPLQSNAALYDKITATVNGQALPQEREVDVPNESPIKPPPKRSGNLFVGLETDFPCLLKNPSRGPEPEYHKVVSGYQTFEFNSPFYCKYNHGVLPGFQMAYETWGELNEDKSNAILLAAGLSASSHAKSHADNEKPGWWEKFIGPGCAVDTNKYFVICTNTLGGCYGSSGPSSINPETGKPYGTTFPVLSVFDMVNAQFLLLDHLGIDKLYATVGSSLGGMCSLSACVQFPDRVGRMISISSCAESHPTSVAVRYLQRKCIMTDPNWNNGHYYGKTYPRNGMKLARELGTMTYRSGPEWDERFSRKRIDPNEDPALCPTFLIESYLDYQGEMFCTMYDPNSLLYISKAMDLFDVAEDYCTMHEALSRVKCPVMVIGVSTDILFPIWQQRELAAACRDAGNSRVTFYELDSIYGHDTFLLDLNGVGSAVKGFLETEQTVYGRVRPRKD